MARLTRLEYYLLSFLWEAHAAWCDQDWTRPIPAEAHEGATAVHMAIYDHEITMEAEETIRRNDEAARIIDADAWITSELADEADCLLGALYRRDHRDEVDLHIDGDCAPDCDLCGDALDDLNGWSEVGLL